MRKTGVALAIGFVVGLTLTAWAARNASGTYSLPAGNPVVTGTSISSTWANNTLSDIRTEITASLDRNGRGAMLAPLQLSNGTSSAPSLTFGTETNSGLYRAGTQDVRLQLNATQVQKWTSSVTTVSNQLFTAANLNAHAATSSNDNAIDALGDGTGAGIEANGGETSGRGGYFTGGAPNGIGVFGQGTGTGYGGYFSSGSGDSAGVRGLGHGTEPGGDFYGGENGAGVRGEGGATTGSGGEFSGGGGSSAGVLGTGGASNGPGVRGDGTGSGYGGMFTGGSASGAGISSTGGGNAAGGTFAGGVSGGPGVTALGTGTSTGGQFSNGTAATGGTRRSAITLLNGDIDMTAVADPDSTTAVTDKLTPKNITKAWSNITFGSASPSVNDGFNTTSVACASSELTVTLANSFTSSNYAVFATTKTVSRLVYAYPASTSTIKIGMYDDTGAPVNLCSTTSSQVYVMALGAQ